MQEQVDAERDESSDFDPAAVWRSRNLPHSEWEPNCA
jgi:hypothetical protein